MAQCIQQINTSSPVLQPINKEIKGRGLEGKKIEVETDISKGLPAYDVVGLPDASVKESRERVRSAVKNAGYLFPANKITVNLAPADLKRKAPA